MPSFKNPVLARDDHADPVVVKYLDRFYLYHSGALGERKGISVYESRDLVAWEFQGFALEASETGWAYSDLTAPDVLYERGVFYMYVTAAEEQPAAGGAKQRHLGVARATHPLGPFQPAPAPLLSDWAVDGHPFRDDDGSLWLFYDVRIGRAWPETEAGDVSSVVDRLLKPGQLEGHPSPTVLPSQEWEYGEGLGRAWNQSVWVLKRRGRYWQMYAGGPPGRERAVGLASARDLREIMWDKLDENPIFKGGGAIEGAGHHSLVFGPDLATRYSLYHGYVQGEEGLKVHLDRFFWRGDRPFVVGPTEDAQPCPPAPLYERAVPHWRAEAWVQGQWVSVSGRRYQLPSAPADAWHRVEAAQSDGRRRVRVGGALVADHPGTGEPEIDGPKVKAQARTSCLEDDQARVLPGGSVHSFAWGGEADLELHLALKGPLQIEIAGATYRLQSPRDSWRLERLVHRGGGEEIVLRAGQRGCEVADLTVYARRGSGSPD